MKYTLSDLQNRYGLEKSAIHKFLSRHIEEINQNGQHAVKSQNKWFFDDFAISIMDRLRGIGQVIPGDQQMIADLQGIIENLRQELISAQKANLKSQEDVSELKDRLIAVLEEKAKIKDQLAGVSFELLRLQNDENDLHQLVRRNESLEDELHAQKTNANQLEQMIKKLESEKAELEKENQKLNAKPKSETKIYRFSRRKQPSRIKINAIS